MTGTDTAVNTSTERADALQHWEVYECPVWCQQPDDEHEYEDHFGPWRWYTLRNNGTWTEIDAPNPEWDCLRIRMVVSWFWFGGAGDSPEYNDAVAFEWNWAISGEPPYTRTTVGDWETLQALFEDLQQEYALADPGMKPAYPGAADDEQFLRDE